MKRTGTMTAEDARVRVNEIWAFLDARRTSPDGIPVKRAGTYDFARIYRRYDVPGSFLVDDTGSWYTAESIDEAKMIIDMGNEKANLMHSIAWAEIRATGDTLGPVDQLR